LKECEKEHENAIEKLERSKEDNKKKEAEN